MTPMWNRLLPNIIHLRDSSWLESDFQVYCSVSKRIQLPSMNTVKATYGYTPKSSFDKSMVGLLF